MSTVVVAGFGKREVMKVAPNTTLSQLRDAFCAKHSISSPATAVFLRTHSGDRRTFDMSLPFRISGVSSGQTLELARSSAPKSVNVALQFPDGSRHQSTHDSGATLWDVLCSKESLSSRPITSVVDAATGKYSQPSVVFMNREFATVADLRRMSLAQIGASSGAVLLRLSFKPTDMSIETALATEEGPPKVAAGAAKVTAVEGKEEADVAMDGVASPQSAVEKRAREKEERLLAQWELDDAAVKAARDAEFAMAKEIASMASPTLSTASTSTPIPPSSSIQQPIEASVAADVAPMETTEKPPIAQPSPVDVPENERTVLVFPPSDVAFDSRAIEIPDEFYDLTMDDLATIREAEKRAKAESSVLMTKEMRERLRLQQRPRFRRHARTDTTPPMEPLGDGKQTMWQRQLVPAALVYLKWIDPSKVPHPFLKPELMASVRERLPLDWSYAPPSAPSISDARGASVAHAVCAGCISQFRECDLSFCLECDNKFCGPCWKRVHDEDGFAGHHKVDQQGRGRSAAHSAGPDAGDGSSTGSSGNSGSDKKKSTAVPKWFVKGKRL